MIYFLDSKMYRGNKLASYSPRPSLFSIIFHLS